MQMFIGFLYASQPPAISKLPPEILEEIFLYSGTSLGQTPCAFVLEVVEVCQDWRKMCLQRAIFWTKILVTNGTTAGQLKSMLERSAEKPLHITLYAEDSITRGVFDQLIQSSVLHRWISFALKVPPHVMALLCTECLRDLAFPALECLSFEAYKSGDELPLKAPSVLFRKLVRKKPPLSHLQVTMSGESGARPMTSFRNLVLAYPTITRLTINVLSTPTNGLGSLLSVIFHWPDSEASNFPLPNLALLDIRYPAETSDSVDVERGQWSALGAILRIRQDYAQQLSESGVHPLQHLHFYVSVPRGKSINLDRSFEELRAGGLQVHLHYEVF